MNPIIKLLVYLLLVLSIILSDTFFLLGLHFLIFLINIFIKRAIWYQWWARIKPFCFYLPITSLFFCLVSLAITSRTIDLILIDIFAASLRLFLMVSIMLIYVLESQNRILFAIRSLWYSTNLNVHFIDKFLLFFEMAIRFFPNIQYKWNQTQRSQNALSIKISRYSFQRIIQIAQFIPDFIILNLDNSNHIVENMYMRGYGKIARRSIYPFVKIHFYDIVILISILVCVIVVHAFR